MPRRSQIVSGSLIAGALLLTTLGLGGVAATAGTPPAPDDASAVFAVKHAGHTMAVSTAASPRTRTVTATSPRTRR